MDKILKQPKKPDGNFKGTRLILFLIIAFTGSKGFGFAQNPDETAGKAQQFFAPAQVNPFAPASQLDQLDSLINGLVIYPPYILDSVPLDEPVYLPRPYLSSDWPERMEKIASLMLNPKIADVKIAERINRLDEVLSRVNLHSEVPFGNPNAIGTSLRKLVARITDSRGKKSSHIQLVAADFYIEMMTQVRPHIAAYWAPAIYAVDSIARLYDFATEKVKTKILHSVAASARVERSLPIYAAMRCRFLAIKAPLIDDRIMIERKTDASFPAENIVCRR